MEATFTKVGGLYFCGIKTMSGRRFPMLVQSEEIDYCGIIILLRQLVQAGKCSRAEAKNIALRISAQFGTTLIFPL